MLMVSTPSLSSILLCLLVAAYLVLVIVAVTLLGVLLGAGLLVGVSSCCSWLMLAHKYTALLVSPWC